MRSMSNRYDGGLYKDSEGPQAPEWGCGLGLAQGMGTGRRGAEVHQLRGMHWELQSAQRRFIRERIEKAISSITPLERARWSIRS